METIGIAVLFVVMLAAPCLIAARSSGKQKYGNEPYGECDDDAEAMEDFKTTAGPVSASHILPVDRPLTLPEIAARAENDARIAQELAHEAHYAALTAAAYAARLRAEAAIEAATLAERAIREAPLRFDGEYQSSAIEQKGRAA